MNKNTKTRNRVWPINPLRKVFKHFITLLDLSHSHQVVGMVVQICYLCHLWDDLVLDSKHFSSSIKICTGFILGTVVLQWISFEIKIELASAFSLSYSKSSLKTTHYDKQYKDFCEVNGNAVGSCTITIFSTINFLSCGKWLHTS